MLNCCLLLIKLPFPCVRVCFNYHHRALAVAAAFFSSKRRFECQNLARAENEPDGRFSKRIREKLKLQNLCESSSCRCDVNRHALFLRICNVTDYDTMKNCGTLPGAEQCFPCLSRVQVYVWGLVCLYIDFRLCTVGLHQLYISPDGINLLFVA